MRCLCPCFVGQTERRNRNKESIREGMAMSLLMMSLYCWISHIGKGEIIEKLWRGQVGVYQGGKGDKKKHGEQPKVVQKEAQSGCCQGANGVSCCRDERSEVKSQTGLTNKQFDRLSDWIGSFEQENVLAAAAVVTGVATIAVAYSFYSRSA